MRKRDGATGEGLPAVSGQSLPGKASPSVLRCAEIEGALEEIWSSRGPALLSMAAEVLADTRGALVVVEEALARLRREAERLPAGTPIPEIWLWLEVRRLALRQRHASRSKANPAEAPGGKFPLLVSWMPTQKDLAQLESRRALLKKLLRQLPRHQQQALALAVWEGLTEPEIAARLGEPLARVQSSLRAGMRFIRHRMNVVLGKWSVPI